MVSAPQSNITKCSTDLTLHCYGAVTITRCSTTSFTTYVGTSEGVTFIDNRDRSAARLVTSARFIRAETGLDAAMSSSTTSFSKTRHEKCGSKCRTDLDF
jgi:hypothetical protein